MTAFGTIFRIYYSGFPTPEYIVANDDPKDAENRFRQHNQVSEIIKIERIGYGHIYTDENY